MSPKRWSETRESLKRRRPTLDWAALLKRTFDIVKVALGVGASMLEPGEGLVGEVAGSLGQAVQAQIDLGANTAVAMHFGTFPLADDGETESVEKLGVRSDFWVLGFGEGRDVP
jgi:hypothetical protein